MAKKVKISEVQVHISTYITKDGKYGACIGTPKFGDFGEFVEGDTKEECVQALIPFLKGYMDDAEQKHYINQLCDILKNKDCKRVNLYDKHIRLYEDDKKGQPLTIREIDWSSWVSIRMDNGSVYDPSDLEPYELKMIINALKED